MDNKPTIDVYKCKHRDKYTSFCLAERNGTRRTYTLCTGTNCYFKKLKRKEQECEELKRKSEEQSWRYAELDADFDQLKAWKAQAEQQLKHIKDIVLNKCIDSNLKCEEIIKVLQTIYEVE